MDIRDISQNFEVTAIAPDKLGTLIEDDPLLQAIPPTFSDTSMVVWEQPENGYGLLSLRGQDGEPDVTTVPGVRQMRMVPGYYGERVFITEKEMDEAREYGTPNQPMNIEKRLGYMQDQILGRYIDRMRTIASSLFRTGRYIVYNASGSASHADTLDGYTSRNVFAPAVGWAASPATADPIGDLLGWKVSLELGTDSRFDTKSELLCATPTINDILATNQIRSQIKVEYGNTVAGLEKLNGLLKAYNLPALVAYDESYYETKVAAAARTGAIRVIPHKSLIWKGYRRDGAQAACFQFTRSSTKDPPAGVAQNANGYKVNVTAGRGELASQMAKGLWSILQYQLVPAKYIYSLGFNGGPAVSYPSAFAGISYD